ASSATMFSEGKSAILDRVLDPNQPDFTYIALLFDGPYALAAALSDGELTQRQYRDDRVGDPGLRALYDKVQMVPDLTMGVFGAEVTVTVGGRDYTSFVDCIRENVNAGFTADDKFRLTAAEVLPAAQMAQVLDAIERLAASRHLGGPVPAARGASAAGGHRRSTHIAHGARAGKSAEATEHEMGCGGGMLTVLCRGTRLAPREREGPFLRARRDRRRVPE